MAHISSFVIKIIIHLSKKVSLSLLLIEKVNILAKYSNFTNVFLKKLAEILFRRIRANKPAIKRKQSKQLLYKPIYNLGLVVPKTFRIYIEINLANNFIRLLKLQTSAQILFIEKPEDNFYLCVNFQKFNNLIIKKQYLLPVIGKSFNQLS